MRTINKELARKGNLVAITNQFTEGGTFDTRIYVDTNGELTAGLRCAEHKTLKGAENWAKSQLDC